MDCEAGDNVLVSDCHHICLTYKSINITYCTHQRRSEWVSSSIKCLTFVSISLQFAASQLAPVIVFMNSRCPLVSWINILDAVGNFQCQCRSWRSFLGADGCKSCPCSKYWGLLLHTIIYISLYANPLSTHKYIHIHAHMHTHTNSHTK